MLRSVGSARYTGVERVRLRSLLVILAFVASVFVLEVGGPSAGARAAGASAERAATQVLIGGGEVDYRLLATKGAATLIWTADNSGESSEPTGVWYSDANPTTGIWDRPREITVDVPASGFDAAVAADGTDWAAWLTSSHPGDLFVAQRPPGGAWSVSSQPVTPCQNPDLGDALEPGFAVVPTETGALVGCTDVADRGGVTVGSATYYTVDHYGVWTPISRTGDEENQSVSTAGGGIASIWNTSSGVYGQTETSAGSWSARTQIWNAGGAAVLGRSSDPDGSAAFLLGLGSVNHGPRLMLVVVDAQGTWRTHILEGQFFNSFSLNDTLPPPVLADAGNGRFAAAWVCHDAAGNLRPRAPVCSTLAGTTGFTDGILARHRVPDATLLIVGTGSGTAAVAMSSGEGLWAGGILSTGGTTNLHLIAKLDPLVRGLSYDDGALTLLPGVQGQAVLAYNATDAINPNRYGRVSKWYELFRLSRFIDGRWTASRTLERIYRGDTGFPSGFLAATGAGFLFDGMGYSFTTTNARSWSRSKNALRVGEPLIGTQLLGGTIVVCGSKSGRGLVCERTPSTS